MINVICNLLYGSKGKYLITFIPDCARWRVMEDFYDAICLTFDSSRAELGIRVSKNEAEETNSFNQFIAAIDNKLNQQGRRWVFVFDHVNNIFEHYSRAGDVTVLPYPFHLMWNVMKPRRITSIIVTTANNEIGYKDSLSDFVEYKHPISFRNKKEAFSAFPDF